MAKRKRTNRNLQNITHKTKDRITQTPLKTGTGDGLRCSGKVGVPAPLVVPVELLSRGLIFSQIRCVTVLVFFLFLSNNLK